MVAATAREAAHVPDGLPLVVSGMGKTAAATATARALAGAGDKDLIVVNVGTAGALRDEVTGLHEVGTVLNHDMNADAIRALGYDPMERIVVGPGEIVLASGDVFVADRLVREALARRAHLVDMEGYAVAYACRAFGVPVRLIKHVSDNADDTAVDWPHRLEASARALGRWLRENL